MSSSRKNCVHLVSHLAFEKVSSLSSPGSFSIRKDDEDGARYSAVFKEPTHDPRVLIAQIPYYSPPASHQYLATNPLNGSPGMLSEAEGSQTRTE